MLLALGLEDRGLTHAFRFQDHRALLALGLHLPGHRVDDVLRRADVAQLDAGDLHAPDSVALSTTASSRVLISSRLDRVSSRSIEPMTVRRLVVERAMIAV